MAWWIFQNLVMTTALAAVVALVCRAGRIGPVARHALWVLVLVKFVTPPLVVWPWAAPDPLGIAAFDARPIETERVTTAEAAHPPSVAFDVDEDVTWSRPPAPPPAPPPTRASAMAESGALAWPWVLALWAAGSLCLLTIEAVRVLRLARRIRQGTAAHEAVASRVAVLAAQMGIQPVPIVTVDGCTSPAVWGVGRPLLLWPRALPPDCSDACIDGLLVHELAHVKRGDHLVGWIELAAGIVWWWNPLFWWVRSALREQAELACDGWVISALPNGRRAYAESLLALSGAVLRGRPSSMAVVGIRATSRRVLERRLVMIMKGRTPLRLPFVGLCALALVASATLPAWATSQQPPPPPPPPPAPAVQSTRTPPPPPPPAPAAPRRAVQTARPAQPPPPPPPPDHLTMTRRLPSPAAAWTLHRRVPANMPADGKALLDAFAKEQEAIQKEADQKMTASGETLTNSLQALQDRFTKEGKLDEAVAIRDYLRSASLPLNRAARTPVIRR